MNTLDCIRARHSTRKFTEESLPTEVLKTLAEAACHAPSGMNRQTFQFTVISDRDKIAALAEAEKKPLGRDQYDMYKPAAIILCSDERDNTNGLADCACAMENIYLAATDLGIGMVWINQLKCICDDPDVRARLTEYQVPENHIVWGIAALGYAAEEPKARECRAKVVML